MMNTTLSSEAATRLTPRLLMVAGCLLTVPLALFYGFRFGDQLMGPLLGVVTAANTALLAVLTVDFLVDKLLALRERAAPD